MKRSSPVLRGLFYTALGVFIASCSPLDRDIEPASAAITIIADSYRQANPQNILQLAATDEPGTPLLILGRLTTPLDRNLPTTPINFYHADAVGNYDESVPGSESSARIHGQIVTDSTGRFMISTIVPGAYGNTNDGGHIHLSVDGAQPAAYDVYFRQYASRGVLQSISGSSQAIALNLHSFRGDTLIAISSLPVRGFDSFD